ncbi:4240_t:CDS:1 [Paraglomus occultum]|uniref:4240_t:CDS:1 n=1 Tax=Paraglomus occultum TaxID=144539 RepID=A0A9N8WMX3_9GLOM|nr:4240_t:CDS:1 [Paraglomus occultum]
MVSVKSNRLAAHLQFEASVRKFLYKSLLQLAGSAKGSIEAQGFCDYGGGDQPALWGIRHDPRDRFIKRSCGGEILRLSPEKGCHTHTTTAGATNPLYGDFRCDLSASY